MKDFLHIFLIVISVMILAYFIMVAPLWLFACLFLFSLSLFVNNQYFGALVFFAIIAFLFVNFKIYASLWFWFSLVGLVVVSQVEFLRVPAIQFLAVVFGAVYLPINFALMRLAPWVKELKREDTIAYWIMRALLFPFHLLVIVFSIPYEWLLDHAH